MNNTKTLAIVAVLMAATLVVGTFATVATTQFAFAYAKRPVQDGKKTRDDGSGNSKNGNTVTIEECKNRGSASGFDTATNQECENLICTHPGDNATCVQEGAVSAAAAAAPQTPIKLTCEECFTKFLTPGQLTAVLASFLGRNLENTCLSTTISNLDLLISSLNAARVSEDVQLQLIRCLVNSGIPIAT
jgi:hypothetical protein